MAAVALYDGDGQEVALFLHLFTLLVSQIWLRDPARIEGLLTCHFIAMLLSSLIERTIRYAMTRAGIEELSL